MQGKEQHQHASRGVASMMSGPVVVDVLEEGWVEDLHLVGGDRIKVKLLHGKEGNVCVFVKGNIFIKTFSFPIVSYIRKIHKTRMFFPNIVSC